MPPLEFFQKPVAERVFFNEKTENNKPDEDLNRRNRI